MWKLDIRSYDGIMTRQLDPIRNYSNNVLKQINQIYQIDGVTLIDKQAILDVPHDLLSYDVVKSTRSQPNTVIIEFFNRNTAQRIAMLTVSIDIKQDDLTLNVVKF